MCKRKTVNWSNPRTAVVRRCSRRVYVLEGSLQGWLILTAVSRWHARGVELAVPGP
jgi:hypothetical protein